LRVTHPHAALHVTGEARYVDDGPDPAGTLHAYPVVSAHAHARLLGIDASAALACKGVQAVLTAADVPGHNAWGPVVADEELFARDVAVCVGQPIALVVATTRAEARAAAARVVVRAEPLPAIVDLEAGIAAGAFYGAPHVIASGNVAAALAASPHRLSGAFRTGGQDHFYLETHAALALPGEDGAMTVWSSTQHPTEVQAVVAEALGRPRASVDVIAPRMGGGFGGKETQAAPWAARAAVAAARLGRPVRIALDRAEDMAWTGGRHPFLSRWEVGFDGNGQILAFRVDLWADAGCSQDLSLAIVDRALFHLDNACFVPACRFEGRAVRTNTASATAFRGFGGPQGAFVIEAVLDRIAEALGASPEAVRRRNLYRLGRDRAPYGQPIEDPRAERVWDALVASADVDERQRAIAAFNASEPSRRRALAVTAVKFGISFTTSFLNQAGAYVRVYADGSVQVDHGGTEMGQGLVAKVAAVAAHTLGVPVGAVRQTTTATDRVPNTSATAASSGSDLNGAAVQDACATIAARLEAVAAELLGGPVRRDGPGWAHRDGTHVDFATVCRQAWLRRVPLAATGFYATPGIAYDRAAGLGRPFHYFAWGCGATEVEVDGLTGAARVLRVDILHDVGTSLAPDIDRGQIEGAWVQGYGWLTMEEVLRDQRGAVVTTGPSTYKIPGIGDVPEDFRVALLPDAAQPGVVGGSKAVGEPPFLLAIGAHVALRRAVSAFGRNVDLPAPATREALRLAIHAARPRG
jgi:xanthine dehydrogenase large subunit